MSLGDVRSESGLWRPPTGIISSGEIRLSASTLRVVFGRGDVQICTDDGRLLDLRFFEKKLDSATDVAHVVPAAPQSASRSGIRAPRSAKLTP